MPTNLHSLANSGLPLGVRCISCGYRALVDPRRLDAHDGNMKELRRLRLVCSQCGGRSVDAVVFSTKMAADEFLPATPRGQTSF